MGFKPGEGLGKKRVAEPEPELDDAPVFGGGIGSKRASKAAVGVTPSPILEKARTEPIEFQMRSGASFQILCLLLPVS